MATSPGARYREAQIPIDAPDAGASTPISAAATHRGAVLGVPSGLVSGGHAGPPVGRLRHADAVDEDAGRRIARFHPIPAVTSPVNVA